MESTHTEKNIRSSTRGQYFSTLTTSQSDTFTVCDSAKIFSKLYGILSEMLQKAQQGSALNWPIKH